MRGRWFLLRFLSPAFKRTLKTKEAQQENQASFGSRELARYGIINWAERIAYFRSDHAQDNNDDQEYESKNDRVFHQTLAFFLGSE